MTLPYIIEANELENHIQADKLRIVDLSKPEVYRQNHIPGALFLDYQEVVKQNKPVMGLLPDSESLIALANKLDLHNDSPVVAYDDEGGGKAARFLWTLEVMGHQHLSLLNGGLHAWANEDHAMESGTSPKMSMEGSEYVLKINDDPVANREYILDNLSNENVAILDARSAEEYSGVKKFAERAGHIPGAVNLDWLLLMDQSKNLRLKSHEELRLMLGSLEVTADKEVIVYCQTHHRSALTYVALKSLGYNKVRGYPGSWSDWGNCQDTPIE